MNQMGQQMKQAYRLFAKLILGDQVRQGTSTSIKNTLVNVYTMDEQIQTLRYSRLTGILTFDIDRKLKSSFFRMYSMDSFELIFECELYYGFQEYYRQITETMWAFEFLEGIIAFEFLNQSQGLEVEVAVKKHSHKSSEYMDLLEERRKEELNKKKQESFFGKIKSIFNKDTGVKQESKIINVKKQNSITFDQTSGKLENIPPHLELSFSQLGFTKKQLSNKATAQNLVQDLIDYELMRNARDDPSATELRKTLKQIGLEYKESVHSSFQGQSLLGSQGVLQPPPLLQSTSSTGLSQKAQLLEQIRNGVKLKPTTTKQSKIVIEMSSMDKDERDSMAVYLKRRMTERDQFGKRNKKIEDSQDD